MKAWVFLQEALHGFPFLQHAELDQGILLGKGRLIRFVLKTGEQRLVALLGQRLRDSPLRILGAQMIGHQKTAFNCLALISPQTDAVFIGVEGGGLIHRVLIGDEQLRGENLLVFIGGDAVVFPFLRIGIPYRSGCVIPYGNFGGRFIEQQRPPTGFITACEP